MRALGAVTLLAVTLRRYEPLRTVLTADRLRDLGTLLRLPRVYSPVVSNPG